MINPFADNKLDHEKYPVLWFSPRSKKAAERGKATFVNGTRGSGKTAILRSISTRYIFEIPTLSRQLLGKKKLKWFGTYVRLQDSYADFVASDNDQVDDKKEFILFCQYTELMIVAQLITDLIDLRRKKALQLSYDQESNATQNFVSSNPCLRAYATYFGFGDVSNFGALYDLINDILNWLFNIGVGEKWAFELNFIASQPGSILGSAAKEFLEPIRSDYLIQGSKLILKVLIDDCEVLSSKAQKYLNTLMRSKDGNVSWVISFVSNLYDTRSTVRANQMLSEADRHMDYLDNMPEKDFERLCSKIASLRIHQHLAEGTPELNRNDPLNCFDLTNRLGDIDLDDLVAFKRKDSISSKWVEIIETAEVWNELLSRYDTIKVKSQKLPYTLSHAANVLEISPAKTEKNLGTRAGFQRFKRKMARKQRASYLSIFDQIDAKPVYAGKNIILALSDRCVRDFLDIMREIFDRSVPDPTDKTITKFANSPKHIDLSLQNRSVQEASKRKFENINVSSDPYGFEVSRLIVALGKLTRRLQVNGSAGLKNPEINTFSINWVELGRVLEKLGHASDEFDDIIKASGVDGFVRELDKDLNVLSGAQSFSTSRYFRLHSRYAPKFQYSFRGGYSHLPIHSKLFAELLLAPSDFDIDAWVGRVLWFANFKDADPDQHELLGPN